MRIMNIPTLLTVGRLLAVVLLVLVYLLPFEGKYLVAAILFTLAALTDWLDGYLARALGQSTALGAFLDPVADKLLVAITLLLIINEHNVPFLLLPATIIVGREIVISALRERMAELGKRASVAVRQVGRVKTLLQMVALGALIWYHAGLPSTILWLGLLLLYVAAGLTLWSMVVYLKIAWSDLTLASE